MITCPDIDVPLHDLVVGETPAAVVAHGLGVVVLDKGDAHFGPQPDETGRLTGERLQPTVVAIERRVNEHLNFRTVFSKAAPE